MVINDQVIRDCGNMPNLWVTIGTWPDLSNYLHKNTIIFHQVGYFVLNFTYSMSNEVEDDLGSEWPKEVVLSGSLGRSLGVL